MKIRNQFFFVCTILLLTITIFTSCVTTSTGAKQNQTEFDGYWTKKDASKISNSFFDNLDSSSVFEKFFQTYGRKPVVILGMFEDISGEDLNLEMLKTEVENDFISEDDKLEYIQNGSNAAVDLFAEEVGADLQFNATVMTKLEESDSRTTRTFIVTAELCDVNTNEKLWSSENSEISKNVKRTVKK